MRSSPYSCAAAALASAALAALPSFARADIRIIKNNGDAVPVTAYTIAFNPEVGGYDITLTGLYNPNLDSVFDIRASAGEYVHSLVINVNGPVAGSPVIVKLQGEAPGNLLGVGSITQTGSAETILNKVQVTQDIGSVNVEVIGDLIAGRDVLGPVAANTANNSVRGITSVQATRDILGDCTADNGRILLIWAQRNIGSQAAPINIRARHSVYQVMGLDVFANINTRYNGGTGGFWALVANRFSGTLLTEKLINNPWNGLDGLMEIYNQFDGFISIGKNYNSPTQYIQVPANGLAGQIIINADGVAGGAWTAPIRVGPNGHPQQIILNSPGYTASAATIGGGAVGLVPFRLHDEACSPANGATVQRSLTDPPLVVELRHYGPVNWNGAMPVTIERRAAGSTNAFVPVTARNFQVTRTAGGRSLSITAGRGSPGFESGYQYRLRPVQQLYCDISTAPPAPISPPAVAWDADYLLTVIRLPCAGDVNQTGVVNTDDLLLIISLWGQTNPIVPGADANHDGIVNTDDLLIVITSWGACP